MNHYHIDAKPEMIECAFDYFYSIECSSHKPFYIHNVICSLSLEMIFKSFNSTSVKDYAEHSSSYKFSKPKIKGFDSHNLLTLYNFIPDKIKNYLLSHDEVELIKTHDNTFKNSRYTYEYAAEQVFDDSLMRLTARLLCKVVFLYKKMECNHPFIQRFDMHKIYYLYNQIQPLDLYLAEDEQR